MVSTVEEIEALTFAIAELREDYRVKRGTDYAILTKYGEIYVMCIGIYEDTIREVFEKHGVKTARIVSV